MNDWARNLRLPKVIPRREIEAELMEGELSSETGIGVTTWLTTGLKIQELQYVINLYTCKLYNPCRTSLVAFLRKQGKRPSAEQRSEIAQRRGALRRQIDAFHEMAEHLFPSLDVYDINFREVPFGDDVISDGEDDDPTTLPHIPRGDVEKMDLLLPSSWPGRIPPELLNARYKEIQLRLAQADEALEGIRREICHKSYIYRTNVRLAANKKGKQRGYDAANAADRALKHHVRVYRQARWALGALEAPPALTECFQVLHDSDLEALKSIYMPNARGQSSVRIPWIWKVSPSAESDSEYLEERESCPCSHSFLNLCLASLPDKLAAGTGQKKSMGRRVPANSHGDELDDQVLFA